MTQTAATVAGAKRWRSASTITAAPPAISASWKGREQRRDDREVGHRFGGHGGEGVATSRICRGQVRAAVPAEIAGGHDRFAVRAGDKGWAFRWPRARFAGAPSVAPAAVGSPLDHPPPPLM